jgi:hypothetical protein
MNTQLKQYIEINVLWTECYEWGRNIWISLQIETLPFFLAFSTNAFFAYDGTRPLYKFYMHEIVVPAPRHTVLNEC